MNEKINELIQKIEQLTVFELNELIKQLEEKFGVTSMPTFVSGQPSTAAQQEESAPESSKVTVVLTNSGDNKIQIIKVLKEINPQLGLKEAKEIVDNLPQNIKENVDLEEAKKIKEKIESAGGKVEFK